MKEQKQFQPYIPAEKVTPEITVTSIIMGMFLAVIFGAANAYLGLRVGMTVSASIPAAVIAMGVIRVIMQKNSILESNVVQTIGSPVSPWLQVQFLPFLLYIYGRQKALWKSPVLSK